MKNPIRTAHRTTFKTLCMSEIGKEPDKLLLKQKDLIDWLGWTPHQIEGFRKSGALKGEKHGTSDYSYLKKDILKDFLRE